jgi:3-hydroxymyristoyl/3-hydroxydecanoyl-(acyl carrier protein) dehydratase
MSKLKQEIKSSLQEIEETSDLQTTARFCFPKKFIGFKGHFPNKPILPGVCKIQAAMLVLEQRKHKDVRLAEIILAKFFAPVTFNQDLIFKLEEHPKNSSESTVTVKVSSGNKKIAELQLRVNFLES